MAKTNEARLELTAVDVSLSKTVKEAKKSVQDLRETYEKLATYFGIAIGVGTFGEFMKDAIETRAALNDLSATIGGNVRDLDGLRRQAVVSGVAFEQLGTTMSKFAKILNATSESKNEEGQTAAQALKAIGLSADEVRAKAPDQALIEVAKALGMFQDGASKVAVAVALFGRAGAEMLPMLKDIAHEGIEAGHITAEQAAQAEELEHQWRRLKLAFLDGREAIVNHVIPGLADLTQAMLDAQRAGAGFLSTVGAGLAAAFGGNDNYRNQKELVEKTEQLLKMQDQADFYASKYGPDDRRAIASRQAAKDMQAEIQTTLTYRRLLDQEGKPKGESDAPKKTLSFAPKTKDNSAEQELKSYTSALKTYFEALGRLSGMTQSEKAHFELFGQDITSADGKVVHLNGSLEKLTGEHKKNVQALADEATRRQNVITVYEALEEHVKAHTAALEAEQAIQRARRQADVDYLDDLEFQASLIGKTAIEQQQLNEARKVDLNLRQQIRAISEAAGDDAELFTRNVAGAREAAEKQKAAVLDSVNARIAAERSFSTGAKAAIDDYVDHATNAAEQSRTVFTSAFQTLEDLEMDFVFNSGKNWEQLATGFIKQIVRMQLAAQNARMFGGPGGANAQGPIDGLMKWFGWGDGGGSLGGADAAPAAAAMGDIHAFATGGAFMVGGNGGVDTTPISFRATKGERVSIETPEQQRGGGGGHTYIIDARGADAGGLARLESMIHQLNGSVERRAVSAVGALATRRPSFSRALQSHK